LKRFRLIVIFLSTFLLSGCWDKVEIDRNIFISTIGIDAGKDIKKEDELKKIDPEEPFGERKIERLSVTYAFPDISEYNAQKGSLPKNKSIKTEAYSLEDALSNAVMKSSRNINIEQERLLLISKDVFNYPDVMKEIIDYMIRQPRVNRLMKVAIIDGRVEDFMKAEVSMEKNIQTYIEGLMESSERNAAILPVTLNEFLILLSENGNAILPNLKFDKDKKEIAATGVSIIKDFKIEGNLTPQETSVLEMVRGKIKGGKKVVYKNGHPIDMEIDGVSRKVIVSSEDNGNLIFNIKLNIEGRIKGYTIEDNVFENGKQNEIEKNFSSSIKQECEKVIELTQKELDVDPFGIRENIEKFHPFLWDEIKDKWEEKYKDAMVQVNVETNIRRIGVIK
jgi:Ger(x)C family germination protein